MGEASEEEDQDQATVKHPETGPEDEAAEVTGADEEEDLTVERGSDSGTGEDIHTPEVD